MKRILNLLCLAAVAVSPSCRSVVLEDRDACPVTLYLDVTNAGQFSREECIRMGLFRSSDGVLAASDSSRLENLQDRSFHFTLHKADGWNGYGILGVRNSLPEAPANWMIPEGQDADPLYRFDFHADGFEGTATVPVELVKDHAKVLLRFVNYSRFEGAGGQFPFQLVIRGNTCGIEGCSGVPVRGPFRYCPIEDPGGTFRFTLPRQADASLTMELWAKPGLYQQEGLVDSFSLWALFQGLGHVNWEAKNLPDIELEVDYTEARFTLTVMDWEAEKQLTYQM